MVLTERDKKLLYILAIIVLVVGFGALLILPQWEKHAELADQLTTAQKNQTDMETAIASLDAITKANGTAKQKYKEAAEDFYDVMESHAAERMVTQIILSHNLSTSTFDISATPQQASMTAYIASALGKSTGVTEEQAAGAVSGTDDGKNSSSSNSSENADDKTSEEVPKNILVDYISITATGTTKNMQALVDDLVSNYPSILVTSYAITTEKGLTATNQVMDVSQLSLGLNLYMVNKSIINTEEGTADPQKADTPTDNVQQPAAE